MTPLAPTAIIGKASTSSPLRTVMSQASTVAETRATLPEASLTAATFGCFERRTTVSSAMSRPVRLGTL